MRACRRRLGLLLLFSLSVTTLGCAIVDTRETGKPRYSKKSGFRFAPAPTLFKPTWYSSEIFDEHQEGFLGLVREMRWQGFPVTSAELISDTQIIAYHSGRLSQRPRYLRNQLGCGCCASACGCANAYALSAKVFTDKVVIESDSPIAPEDCAKGLSLFQFRDPNCASKSASDLFTQDITRPVVCAGTIVTIPITLKGSVTDKHLEGMWIAFNDEGCTCTGGNVSVSSDVPKG